MISHTLGNPFDIDSIVGLCKKYNLWLIEDNCDALGSKWDNINVVNFRIVSSFSFFFSHHMTTMEGGLIACSRLDIAEQMKILRSHGWLRNVDQIGYNIVDGDLDPRYTFANWGFNLRPTEIQASFGLHQLTKLKDFNLKRNKLAGIFFNYICHAIYYMEFLFGKIICVNTNTLLKKEANIKTLKGKVIFKDWPEAINAVMEYFQTPGGIPGFGDWTDHLDEFDPFRDGKAATRMGTYLHWMIQGFEDGLDRETIMANAAERYAKKWGTDKVIVA